MSDLAEAQKAVVRQELEEHLRELQTLRSRRLGGPSGNMVPPHRVLRRAETDQLWHQLGSLGPSADDEYVFCHNDLSQQNVVVDPKTLKINAIIDWEYAGFIPLVSNGPFTPDSVLRLRWGRTKSTTRRTCLSF